ncbi:MAG: sulfotransferase, partial [Actinomycetota bacterium]
MTAPTHPRVFVVSTGRTGTTFLARFGTDVGAEAHHEPGPWWLRHLSNAYVSGHADHDRAVATLRHRRADAGTSSPYLEASCLIYGLVGPLLDAFDDARVVQVVRDPRTYVRSGLAWGVYRFGGRPLNLAPYRRLAPPQFRPWSPAERARWAGQDQFARLCWGWAAMNRAMRTQGGDHERFRTVRFEDLVDDGRGPATLARITADLGLSVDPDLLADAVAGPVNASRDSTDGDWRSWSTERLRLLVDRTAAAAAVRSTSR